MKEIIALKMTYPEILIEEIEQADGSFIPENCAFSAVEFKVEEEIVPKDMVGKYDIVRMTEMGEVGVWEFSDATIMLSPSYKPKGEIIYVLTFDNAVVDFGYLDNTSSFVEVV